MSDLSDETLMALRGWPSRARRSGVKSSVIWKVTRRCASGWLRFPKLAPMPTCGASSTSPCGSPFRNHLVDLVMAPGTLAGAGQGARMAPSQETRSIFDKIRDFFVPQSAGWSSAFAYSAAVAAGLSLGWVLARRQRPACTTAVADAGRHDGLIAGLALGRSLETVPSGPACGPRSPGRGSAPTRHAWRLCRRSHSAAGMVLIAGNTR